MGDLALQDVPRDGEIVEVLYRLARPVTAGEIATSPARPALTHLDMTVATTGEVRALRYLRFTGPRVVQFQTELPDVLQGLDVQDIRDQNLADLALWVSAGGGAVTFWARAVSEITPRRSEADATAHAASQADPAPLIAAEQVRAWGSTGLPQTSFRYRGTGRGGALRHFTVSTRPYQRV